MNIIRLINTSTDTTDAIIIAKTSTKEQITKRIENMQKTNNYDWQWEDLVDCLPEDCEIYDFWQYEDKIYY